MAHALTTVAAIAALLLPVLPAHADPAGCQKQIVKQLLKFEKTYLKADGKCLDIKNKLDLPGPCQAIDADEGRVLNRDYRGKDYATNVLTFDYEREPVVVADLVLCAPVVEREARAARRPLQAHYAHLLVHGALHAQGFEHETSTADAKVMEARESALMQALGFADPYGR